MLALRAHRNEMDSEERRAQLVKRGIPRGYRPWLHLFLPSLVAAIAMSAAIGAMHALRAVELWTIPITYIAALGFEWRAHKDILHRPLQLLTELYKRHEKSHHVIFTADDMRVRSRDEWSLVLMPWFAIVLIILVLLPTAWAVAALTTRNCGLLVLCTGVIFFLQYEWMHLAYHLPADHPVSRVGAIRFLGALHTSHHDPRNMKRWNFNVTVPLFDVLHGTLNRDALHAQQTRATTDPSAAHKG